MPKSPQQVAARKLAAAIKAKLLCYDRVTVRQNGTVELRQAYFYGIGKHAAYANRVACELSANAIPYAAIDSTEELRNWPKTSYYVAVLTPVVER